MQITVKVDPKRKKPATAVRKLVKEARPDLGKDAHVEEVFPGQTAGRRAGMVMVDLPDRLSTAECEDVMRTLRGHADVEYAEPATRRKSRKE
jgi:hypothetical protein